MFTNRCFLFVLAPFYTFSPDARLDGRFQNNADSRRRARSLKLSRTRPRHNRTRRWTAMAQLRRRGDGPRSPASRSQPGVAEHWSAWAVRLGSSTSSPCNPCVSHSGVSLRILVGLCKRLEGDQRPTRSRGPPRDHRTKVRMGPRATKRAAGLSRETRERERERERERFERKAPDSYAGDVFAGQSRSETQLWRAQLPSQSRRLERDIGPFTRYWTFYAILDQNARVAFRRRTAPSLSECVFFAFAQVGGFGGGVVARSVARPFENFVDF